MSLPSKIFLIFLVCFCCFHELVLAQIKLKKGAPHVILNKPANYLLRGTVKDSRDGRQFYAFLGVRYAKPPLRFQLPEPLEDESTLEAHDAFQFGPSCARWSRFLKKYEGSEDCLYLNVYVPMKDAPKSMPVMLYIHGGAFVDGESDTHGPEYFMDENVILVVINYRLGAIGFLSTGDAVIPGNMALHDQKLAINWVHENIRTFGGDVTRFTIFGESAGGASVNLQMLHPDNFGKFTSAISQSGTASCPWVIKHKGHAKKYLNKLTKLVGCSSNGEKNIYNSEEIINCLNTKSWQEILDAQNKTQKWFPGLSIPFGPVIEPKNTGKPSFLTEDPELLMASGKFMNIPYIVGVNEEEGFYIYSEVILKNGKLLHLLNNNFNKIAPDLYHFDHALKNQSQSNEVTEEIKKLYFADGNNKPISHESNKKGVVDLSSDVFFNIGVQDTAKLLVKNGGKVFMYVFSYKGKEHTLVSSLMKENKIVVSHADELKYLFKTVRFGPKDGFLKGSESEKISKAFVKLWVSFTENGTPGKSFWINNSTSTKDWTQLINNYEHLHWYELNTKTKVLKPFHKNRFNFWNEIRTKYFKNFQKMDAFLRKDEL